MDIAQEIIDMTNDKWRTLIKLCLEQSIDVDGSRDTQLLVKMLESIIREEA